MFEQVEKYWNAFKATKGGDLKTLVPNLQNLDNIQISQGRSNATMLEVTLSNLSMTVDDGQHVSLLKNYIIKYFKTFSDVKIKNTGHDDLILYITNLRQPSVQEAALKVLKRKGNTLVSTMKCISGPKKNQRVGNEKTCTAPLNTNMSIQRKISAKANKNQIKNKKKLTSIKSAVVHRRLVKANQMRKKARGGLF